MTHTPSFHAVGTPEGVIQANMTQTHTHTVLVLVEQHKLEQDAATGMQLATGQNKVHIRR